MWIDIVYVLLIIFGFIKGWKQGLIISVFATLAWIVGILGALKLCGVASVYLRQQFDWHSAWLPIVSFLLVFIVIALIIYLIGKSLEKVIEIAQLGFLNKISGAILRVAIYTFIFSTFLWLINQAGWVSPSVKTQSKTYCYLEPVSQFIMDKLSAVFPDIKNLFSNLEHFFEELAK